MKIKIDENLCIGCGSCEASCPKIFKLNQEKMKAEVLAPETEEECAKVAEQICPVKAIIIAHH